MKSRAHFAKKRQSVPSPKMMSQLLELYHLEFILDSMNIEKPNSYTKRQ
jgi:hypothetical protein